VTEKAQLDPESLPREHADRFTELEVDARARRVDDEPRTQLVQGAPDDGGDRGLGAGDGAGEVDGRRRRSFALDGGAHDVERRGRSLERVRERSRVRVANPAVDRFDRRGLWQRDEHGGVDVEHGVEQGVRCSRAEVEHDVVCARVRGDLARALEGDA
jgi:hypothetical protein